MKHSIADQNPAAGSHSEPDCRGDRRKHRGAARDDGAGPERLCGDNSRSRSAARSGGAAQRLARAGTLSRQPRTRSRGRPSRRAARRCRRRGSSASRPRWWPWAATPPESSTSPAVTPRSSTPRKANVTICNPRGSRRWRLPRARPTRRSGTAGQRRVAPGSPRFDEREPKLQLAEELHGDEVHAVKHTQSYRHRNHSRDMREPVVGIDADGGGALGHSSHHPHKPVGSSRSGSRPVGFSWVGACSARFRGRDL